MTQSNASFIKVVRQKPLKSANEQTKQKQAKAHTWQRTDFKRNYNAE